MDMTIRKIGSGLECKQEVGSYRAKWLIQQRIRNEVEVKDQLLRTKDVQSKREINLGTTTE